MSIKQSTIGEWKQTMVSSELNHLMMAVMSGRLDIIVTVYTHLIYGMNGL